MRPEEHDASPNPIKELCELLDEQGVSCYLMSDSRGESVLWKDDNHIRWQAYRHGDKLDVIPLHTLPPAQAVAATVNVGTCTYIPDDTGFTWWDGDDNEHLEEDTASEDCGSASCDHCGFSMLVGDMGWFDGWEEITTWYDESGCEHNGYLLEPTFRHCPNCGRKVRK